MNYVGKKKRLFAKEKKTSPSGLPDDFQAKNSNLGTFWRDLKWKMLVYFMPI
jgi:hypothetical protein